MSYRDRLVVVSPIKATSASEMDFHSPSYQQLKHRLHQTLLERIDLERLQQLSTDQFRRELSHLVERLIVANARDP